MCVGYFMCEDKVSLYHVQYVTMYGDKLTFSASIAIQLSKHFLCTADNVLLTVAQLWELKYILTYDKLSRQREDK